MVSARRAISQSVLPIGLGRTVNATKATIRRTRGIVAGSEKLWTHAGIRLCQCNILLELLGGGAGRRFRSPFTRIARAGS